MNGTVKNKVIGAKKANTKTAIARIAKKLSGNDTITNLFFASLNPVLTMLCLSVFIC